MMISRTTAFSMIVMLALSACGGNERTTQQEDGREVLYWYDPMHPEHRFDAPGPSPFMDMDLVPRYADENEPGGVHVAAGIQQAMNVRTALVERGRMWRRIDTVGRVDVDESRVHHVHPRVEGWVETVGVNAVGEPVEAGQLLFTLYSPALVNAQEEFLDALRRGDAGSLRAAREKLRALDVQPEAVEALERAREVRRALPWVSRHDGIVTRLGIRHGMFVEPGDMMLELADLNSVWVHAEVFDRHAGWLATGQPAEITSSYAPGRTMESVVSYIYPVLDEVTRTVRVRIPLDNPGITLKPGAWTSVRIFAGPVDGVVMIPREALIRTGRSNRVVLRDGETRFSVREVTPGIESGDRVEIRDGLVPGEEVVVSGQFLLDSEAALRAGHGRLEGAGHRHD